MTGDSSSSAFAGGGQRFAARLSNLPLARRFLGREDLQLALRIDARSDQYIVVLLTDDGRGVLMK